MEPERLLPVNSSVSKSRLLSGKSPATTPAAPEKLIASHDIADILFEAEQVKMENSP